MTRPAPVDTVDRALLRRVMLTAVLLTGIGAVVCSLVADLESALALTLGGTVSIVALRSLQGLVGGLRANSQGRIGCLVTFWLTVRAALLAALVVAIFAFGSKDILALLVGISAIPAALTIEAGRGLNRARSGDERHG